jgi:hypothetical protein
VVKIDDHTYVIYANEVRNWGTTGTVAWMANNPGCIRDGTGLGAFSTKLPTSKGLFAIFPDDATGMQAIVTVLKGYGKKGFTVLDAMNQYAPASDGNDPTGYADKVATAMGVTASTALSTLTDAQLQTFSQKIRDVEGWTEGNSYTRADARLPQSLRDRLK